MRSEPETTDSGRGCRTRTWVRAGVCLFGRISGRLWLISGGLAALSWLLFRSGSRPSRLAYPCQQAAFGTAAAAFGVPLTGALLTCRDRLTSKRRGVASLCCVGVVMAIGVTFSLWSPAADTTYYAELLAPSADYHPSVFLVNDARGIAPGRYGGVDDLITLMGTRGFKWHRSAVSGPTSGADGLIAADSVVLIKVNAQWPERGGTNTDVLRGVIRRIVEHPDGFAGEVIVADNGQGRGSMNWPSSNAENTAQSAMDVVADFALEGWDVSTKLWDAMRVTPVAEYADGDMRDGYVVNAVLDAESRIRVSYPKFQSVHGTYVSYCEGVWSGGPAYESDRLVVINLPVFKTHFIYAITAAVKNHMGVVTGSLATDSHAAIARGGLGSLMAESRRPDLTILDAVWMLARPGMGPGAPYHDATRSDKLLASTDPVALDVWATKHVMIPQILANGYQPSDYATTQDPDRAGSVFRRYLDASMSELLRAGAQSTNDHTAVLPAVWAGDVDRDGDLDLADFYAFPDCLTGPAGVVDPSCTAFDADADEALDLRDWAAFQQTFTNP